MKVNLNQAIKMFFGNSSLEMIYFEAIANALDAEATEINVSISIEANNKPKTLEIEISDNGIGFKNKRYNKFSNLLDVDDETHKGLGRLVYLCYFEEVKVISYFEKTKKREFIFSKDFEGKRDNEISNIPEHTSGSTFKMQNYNLQKLAKYEFIQPEYIKNRILEIFYSRLFQIKKSKKHIKININANIENAILQASLSEKEIPKLTKVVLDSYVSVIDKFDLYYSIQEVDPIESSLIAAISIDNRTFKIDLIAEENKILGYKMVFLLFSDFFIGKTEPGRQDIDISNTELHNIKVVFRHKVADLMKQHIPQIRKNKQEVESRLSKIYPHLKGFFNLDDVGFVSRREVLQEAQEKFFNAQKELLEAETLTDEQFKKSLDISARALTEYILFRQITINKLKETTKENSEAELHNLFATMKKEFNQENYNDSLFTNNAWLLDDKYMTFETILSDRELGELIEYITEGEEVLDETGRPDIALVFSDEPESEIPFDVVIVELKKRGLSLEENMKVVTQLEKRARKLMKYYKNKIQRIWYYGIIEFNKEVELALSGRFTELYSSGKMYYDEVPVAISLEPKKVLPIGVFIWDLDAVINDADKRNSAFLNLIKSKFLK